MIESKTQLAKLLATEDIIVRHSTLAKTASFDIKSRVLTLPNWSMADNDVVDMMTGHEVGHSLWTTEELWEEAIVTLKLHKGITNIVEDARIEKLIKQKYPGLVKNFIDGYKALALRKFFYEHPSDIDRMNLVDRITLHCKMGSLSGIPFAPEEQYYVDLVEGVWKEDDVIPVVQELMAFCQAQQDEEAAEQSEALKRLERDSDDMGRDFEELLNDEAAEFLFDGDGNPIEEGDPLPEDLVETQQRFDDAVADRLTEETSKYRDIIYWEIPEANMSDILIPYKKVLSELEMEVKANDKICLHKVENTYVSEAKHIPGESAADFMKFKRNAQKIVGYMAKEFERKKSAQEYRKETVSKTGILDMTKIHSYKYNEDLFLRRTLRPDGKNHGMVMLLDWSASMTYHLNDTLKQIMSLVWFCQKVNIPFEVYAFTNCYYDWDLEGFESREDQKLDRIRSGKIPYQWNLKPGMAHFTSRHGESSFRLLNLYSSRMNAKQLNTMSKLLYRLSYKPKRYTRENWKRFGLGSTPLTPAFCCLDKIIPAFQEYNKLDITNLIVLTDGEGNTEFHGIIPEEEGANVYFRGTDTRRLDKKTRKEYRFDEFSPKMSYYRNGQVVEKQIMGMLKDRYGFRNIGLFIDSGSNGRRIKQRQLEDFLGWKSMFPEEHKRAREEARKTGVATVPGPAFDEYYLVPVGSISEHDGDLEITEEMTASKMKNVFVKHQTQKFGNKILVNKMMDIIA